jgi:L-asparaginase
MQPKLIIHGGAGDSAEGKGGLDPARQALRQIVDQVYQALLAGESASNAVVRACKLLEDEPRFNAGTGSVLQSDGQIRMSASLMVGDQTEF